MIAQSIFASFLLGFEIVLGSLLSAEESRPPPAPVTRQEVWRAVASELRDHGSSEQQLPRVEDLDLPAALPALAGRRLRVSSTCWDEGPRRTQFRLECGEPGQCLPFLVYLSSSVPNSVRAGAPADAGARTASCRSTSGARPAPAVSPNPLVRAAVVRAGERATAVFLAGRLRMTASVTCLERGRENDVIRVRSQNGHIFRARISGPALLEALPQ
jgi:hypothetical protein